MESLSSTSGSSKRARAPTGGNQVVSCLVDGCKSDLSKCRDYHRRHKVCELHSKTPKVTIGGREQRFCQQCSRFHSLGEFDEGKRSCRKRLEGHNRRRRKPQPDSLPVKPGSFLSGARAGSRFMPFSSSPMIPASSVVNSTWSGSVKAENSPTGVYSNQSQIDMLSYTHPLRGRQFPFLQLQGLGSALMIPGSSSSSSSSSSSTTSATGVSRSNSNNHNHNRNELRSSSGAGAGGIRINQGIDSALSLLSSSSHHTAETRLVPQAGLVSGLHYNSNIGQMSSSCPHQLHLQGGSPHSHSHSHSHSQLMPISSNLHHCQDVFPDGSCSVTGPQQTVSFLWE